MRFLREHLKEEVNLTSYTKSGVIDVDDVSVRENINILLKGATARSFITPYIALEKVSKVLANFHIFIPHMSFLEGDHGIEVFDVRQFGMKMGMKDNGEIVTKEAQPYNIYFEYRMNEKGMFDIICKLTEKENIDKELNEAAQYMQKKSLSQLEEALNAAAYVLAEGKREAKIADAKASLIRSTQKGASDKEVDALTNRLRKVAGVNKKIARSAYRNKKELEMLSKANAPTSKSMNESVKKSFE